MAKTKEVSILTKDQLSKLKCYEDIIERGQKTFVDVGNALAGIHDEKLYTETHKTFDAYCKDKWGFKRDYAHKLIEAAEVVENVSNCIQNGKVPETESQARPLTQLPEDKQVAAWKDAVDIAKERAVPVTAAIVEEAVQIHVSQSEPYEEPEGEEPEPPAKAKKAEKIKDANGKTIPEHFNEVFTRGRDSFRDALNLVTQLKKAMNAIASDVLIGPIFAAKGAAGQACRDLDNIRNALRFAMPHAICPYCKGDGCKPCMQAGWVGERVNNSAPPETKK